MKQKPMFTVAGFTLVELMVTVAIIAVLSAIVTANFSSARSKSRDAKRVSDVAQIQLALEFFFDRCNQYPPAPLDVTYVCPTNSTVILSNYISTIPRPAAGSSDTETSLNPSRMKKSLVCVVSRNTLRRPALRAFCSR